MSWPFDVIFVYVVFLLQTRVAILFFISAGVAVFGSENPDLSTNYYSI